MKNTSGVYSTTTAKIDVAISAYWAHAVFDRVETNERENSRSRRPSAVEREAKSPLNSPRAKRFCRNMNKTKMRHAKTSSGLGRSDCHANP